MSRRSVNTSNESQQDELLAETLSVVLFFVWALCMGGLFLCALEFFFTSLAAVILER